MAVANKKRLKEAICSWWQGQNGRQRENGSLIGYSKGEFMRYPITYKLMFIIGLLVFGVSLFAQGSKSRQEILDIINNAPPQRPNSNNVVDYYIRKLAPSDVPIVYDFVFDSTISFDTRKKLSFAASSLNPDKQQIDRAVNYAIHYVPEYDNPQRGIDMAGPFVQSIPALYENTKDDRILESLRELYESRSCRFLCRGVIIETLGKTKAPSNLAFFNAIAHDPAGNVELRNSAALELARSADIGSLPYLREMANYLFAANDPMGKYVDYMAAVSLLGKLGQTHQEASEAIQEIITKVCNYDADNYSWMMRNPGNVEDLFVALKQNGGEGNRKYLENLLDKGCKYRAAKEYAAKALRNIH
jgi:hypothetical protein